MDWAGNLLDVCFGLGREGWFLFDGVNKETGIRIRIVWLIS